MAKSKEGQAVEHPLLYEGMCVKIYGVRKNNGEVPAKEFIENELNEGDQTKVATLFRLLDETRGRISNREKFKHLMDYRDKTIMELKSKQVRMACFWEEDFTLFITNGFIKKADEWPGGKIKIVKNVYDEYLEQLEHKKRH